MTDLDALIAGLRDRSDTCPTDDPGLLLHRAADEIDRLRAELAEARALAESENARGGEARAAIARGREVLRELNVPEQTSWIIDDAIAALEGTDQ